MKSKQTQIFGLVFVTCQRQYNKEKKSKHSDALITLPVLPVYNM